MCVNSMNKGMRASDDTWRVWVCFYLSLICGMLVLASTHELYFRRLYDENNWLLYAAASVVVSSIVYMHVCFSSHNPLHLRLGIFVLTGGSAWLCLVLYSWPQELKNNGPCGRFRTCSLRSAAKVCEIGTTRCLPPLAKRTKTVAFSKDTS